MVFWIICLVYLVVYRFLETKQGVLFESQGEFEKARKSYEKVIAIVNLQFSQNGNTIIIE